MGDVYAEYMKVLKRPDVVLASNKTREKAVSEFKEKYPNADMSKFDFEVDVDLSGKVTGVVVNYKVDEDTSYDITSDGFKSNPKWVKFLYSVSLPMDGPDCGIGVEPFTVSSLLSSLQSPITTRESLVPIECERMMMTIILTSFVLM
jgi:hypothetical protein